MLELTKPKSMFITLIVSILAVMLGLTTGAPAHASTQDAQIKEIDVALDSFITKTFETVESTTGKFNPGLIIADETFYNSNALDTEGIQNFLNEQNKCETTSCLKDYTQAIPDKQPDQYCEGIPAQNIATAAEIIHKVSVACNINPQVILVMLQKEQGLITSENPTETEFNRAMGQNCPDTGPDNSANCDSNYSGFFNQIYYGARQQQVYSQNPNDFNYKAGQNNTIQWNENASCGASVVYIENQATANLYNYTPYQPNIESLSTLQDTGDDCSSYGNRNFYVYFSKWFTEQPAQPYPTCIQPEPEDTQPVNKQRPGTNSVDAYISPNTKCEIGKINIPSETQLTYTAQYGIWAKTSYQGKTYWINTGAIPTTCVQPVTTTPNTQSYITYNTTIQVNARQAPSTECEDNSITIPVGTVVTAVAETDNWIQIQYNNQPYWINKEYLAPGNTETVTYRTNGEVNFRTEPDTAAPSYGMLPADLFVGPALENTENWIKVTLGSRTGYINKEYLTQNQ